MDILVLFLTLFLDLLEAEFGSWNAPFALVFFGLSLWLTFKKVARRRDTHRQFGCCRFPSRGRPKGLARCA